MMSVKFYLCAALLVATVAAMPALDEFEQFKSTYAKIYSATEETIRRAVFEANVMTARAQMTMDDAQYGVTEFMDLTADEFRAQRLGVAGPKPNAFACKPPTTELDMSAVPTSVDWRTKGAVTPVKNQGQCGSCWAFSTAGDLEGTHFQKTGKLVSLSEQNLVDCDKVDQGCGGGLMDQAMETIIKAGGLESEAAYPYTGVAGTCQFDTAKVAANITSYECVGQDEDKLAAYIAANGPVAIAINAGPMQYYMGGVANPLFCDKTKLDHGVLIVGYGVEGSTKKYWIIKNSWGSGWGESGYYRIVRGKGKCGLNTFVVHSVV